MVSAKTIASDTPGYLRIMRIPSFTSSHENAGSHRPAVIDASYYRELYIVKTTMVLRPLYSGLGLLKEGGTMRLFVAAFVLAAVVPARAHHPVTSYYDTSQLVPVTGVVVEFRVNNPHVVLIVDGTTPDGR